MPKITQKLFVHAEKADYEDEFRIEIRTYDFTPHVSRGTTSILLSEVEIEVPIPNYTQEQFNTVHVDKLRADLQKEKADSYLRVTAIEEKIQSLLSIEHQKE